MVQEKVARQNKNTINLNPDGYEKKAIPAFTATSQPKKNLFQCQVLTRLGPTFGQLS